MDMNGRLRCIIEPTVEVSVRSVLAETLLSRIVYGLKTQLCLNSGILQKMVILHLKM